MTNRSGCNCEREEKDCHWLTRAILYSKLTGEGESDFLQQNLTEFTTTDYFLPHVPAEQQSSPGCPGRNKSRGEASTQHETGSIKDSTQIRAERIPRKKNPLRSRRKIHFTGSPALLQFSVITNAAQRGDKCKCIKCVCVCVC